MNLKAAALVTLGLLCAACGGSDNRTFAERVEDADTCAELEEVAGEMRDPGGINPEALKNLGDDPDSERSKELMDGVTDALAVEIRSQELACGDGS